MSGTDHTYGADQANVPGRPTPDTGAEAMPGQTPQQPAAGYPGGATPGGPAPTSGYPGASPAGGHPGAAPTSGYPGAAPTSGYPGAAPTSGYPGTTTPGGYTGTAPAVGGQAPASGPGNAPISGPANAPASGPAATPSGSAPLLAYPTSGPAGGYPTSGPAGGYPAASAQPTSGTPGQPPQQPYYPQYDASANPDGPPSYGPFHNPQNTSYPTSGAGAWDASPTSGAGSHPTSGAATYPTSGPAGYPDPSGDTDQYGLDTTGPGYFGGAPSQGATSYGSDPFGFEEAPTYAGPRIEPTPKRSKGRFLVPALAGLLAGLIVFGTGGYFLGRLTAPGDGGSGPSSPSAGSVYEKNQIAVNQPKFEGTLATISQGWLSQLSKCTRSGDRNGPTLNAGEKTRVRCEMDAMSVIFVEYNSTSDRDKARVTTLGQNVDARTLTPGAAEATTKAAPSGRTNGNYVEYAYQVSGRTVAGLWWDDSATPVSAYMLAYWQDGVAEKWDPMRDVWARYA